MARAILLAEARHDQGAVDDVAVVNAIERFRRDRDLLDENSLQDWADENRLSDDELVTLVYDEAFVRSAAESLAGTAGQYVVDVLRLAGTYRGSCATPR